MQRGIDKLSQLLEIRKQRRLIRFPALVVLFFLYAQSAFSKDIGQELRIADSLFQTKKYTEAFEHYQKVLAEGGSTPQMLLKMAYVKEALNDYPKALYYLNLSYYIHPNRDVLQKMEELAEANDLSGYEFSDYEYIASIYHEYHDQIAIGGTAIIVFGVGFLLWLKNRKSKMVFPSVMLVLFIVFFSSAINFGFPVSHGIVYQSQAFLMNAPSAGAELVSTVKPGHRVEVLEREDIWHKVLWNDEEVYIRSANLLMIE